MELEISLGRRPDPVSAAMQRVFAALGVSSYVDVAEQLSTPESRVSPSTVRNWAHRDNVPEWWLRDVAAKTGYRLEWLRTGVGPERDASRSSATVEHAREPASAYRLHAPPTRHEIPLTDDELLLVANYRALGEPARSTLAQTAKLFVEQAILRRAQNDAAAAEPAVEGRR